MKILEQFKKKKVIVLGDLVLDEYWHGNTGRVSREAPVLILDYEKTTCTLGGAANAVQNLYALGAEIIPLSVVGNDYAGDKIINFLKSQNIKYEGIIRDDSVITPTKIRIMAGCLHTARQQTMRIDKQTKNGYSDRMQEEIINYINKYIETSDALIISDYGLGALSSKVITEVNRLGKEKKIPIIVDSRYNTMKYQNITIVTPNEEEASVALNTMITEENVESNISNMCKHLKSDAVLITMGRAGMALFDGKHYIQIPIVGSQEALDVTGAGDTVTSIITLAYLSGASLLEAAKIANAAASIVIMERGAVTVTLEQLEEVLKESYKEFK